MSDPVSEVRMTTKEMLDLCSSAGERWAKYGTEALSRTLAIEVTSRMIGAGYSKSVVEGHVAETEKHLAQLAKEIRKTNRVRGLFRRIDATLTKLEKRK